MSQENLCDLWDSTKLTNIKIIVSGRKMKNGRERMRTEEIITENFLDQGRGLDIQVQEVIMEGSGELGDEWEGSKGQESFKTEDLL